MERELVEPGRLPDNNLWLERGTCPQPPYFVCTDIEHWWVGWTPGIYASEGFPSYGVYNGELARAYRIVIRDLESGAVLEDHEYEAERGP